MNQRQIAQIEEAIAALRTALAALQALPEAQAPLLAQLAEHEQRLEQLQQQPSHQQGDKVLGDKVLGDKVLGDKHVYVGGGDGPDEEVLLREYLGDLSRSCRRLSLADVESSDPSRAAVDLASVYTLLELASPALPPIARKPDDPELPHQLAALEAVAQVPRLVLLGTPGSGKSTLINFIGLCMAQTMLGNLGWLERLEGWPHGPLLPLRIMLGDLAAWAGRQGRRRRSRAGLIWGFLEQRYSTRLVALLRREVAAGRAVVLLDALDEVAVGRGSTLRRVRESIEALGEAAGSSRIVVTCRILDYEQPGRQLDGWPTETLIPFSETLRHQFIERWYAALAQLARPMNGDPQALRDRLQAEVRGRPELRRLAGNPLLLTMMTLLHAYEGRLPEERVRLYEKCVEFLLHQWRAALGEAPLRELLDLSQWGASDLGRLLDRLGYAAHERGLSGDGEGGADLPRALLIETARAFFAPYGADQDLIRAQIFCNYISRFSNGVLQQHGPDVYRFPHRTFQEYLAARRLVADDWEGDEAEFVDRAMRRVHSAPQWREPIVLAVSQQVVVANQVRPAAQLAEELLLRHVPGSTSAARDAILAGEVLAEIGRERLLRLGPRRASLWDQVAAALVRLLEHLDSFGRPLLPVGERVRAGHALGALGDPRVPLTLADWRSASADLSAAGVRHSALVTHHPALEIYWRRVPAGPFLLGSDTLGGFTPEWEMPQRSVVLPAFQIARFALTNAQWREFVNDDGYRQRRWWSDAGWSEREDAGWLQPEDWDDLRFNGPNQPVVGISWYEAAAFCRWLSAGTGRSVYLPSEAQWEKAARGDDGRRYPWGSRRAISRANTVEGGMGATTPVGCYPDGASPCGGLDMAGNVWEWTATPWSEGYAQRDGTSREEEGGASLVIRGGVWASDLHAARCSSRDGFDPSGRGQILGVRLVMAVEKPTG